MPAGQCVRMFRSSTNALCCVRLSCACVEADPRAPVAHMHMWNTVRGVPLYTCLCGKTVSRVLSCTCMRRKCRKTA